jgi:hypothetical protein
MTEPSPRLLKFLPQYKADDNEWWRLSSGDMQNLFDEAVDEIERLTDELERTVAAMKEGGDNDDVE